MSNGVFKVARKYVCHSWSMVDAVILLTTLQDVRLISSSIGLST